MTLGRLERAVEINDVEVLVLVRDPTFVALHGHPRFQDVLRSAGLPNEG